jgi:DNA processing protein
MDHAALLAEELGSEEAVLDAKARDLIRTGLGKRRAEALSTARKEKSHLAELERTEALGARICVYGFPGYPSRLDSLPAAPPALSLLGHMPEEHLPVLAMIGSRRCTVESLRLATRWARELAGFGFCVVSGMARGIDSAAIRGCLAGSGPAVGVLGSGLDVVYPPENRRLFKETSRSGALLSEFPLGTPPIKPNFPRRNRIISGLSDGLLVVEASQKSGTLITVNHALSQNRTVMAVPGPVGPSHFRGSNTLLRDGACVVLETADILAAMYLSRPDPPAVGLAQTPSRDPADRDILKACRYAALTLEALAHETRLGIEEVVRKVSRLELEGLLERWPGGRFMTREAPHKAKAKK